MKEKTIFGVMAVLLLALTVIGLASANETTSVGYQASINNQGVNSAIAYQNIAQGEDVAQKDSALVNTNEKVAIKEGETLSFNNGIKITLEGVSYMRCDSTTSVSDSSADAVCAGSANAAFRITYRLNDIAAPVNVFETKTELKEGEKYSFGPYVLGVLSIRGNSAIVVVSSTNEVVPSPVNGTEEKPILISKGAQGMQITRVGESKPIFAKTIKIQPGADYIEAVTTESNQEVKMGSEDIAKGIALNFKSGQDVYVSTNKDKLETLIKEGNVSVKTRETLVSDENGLSVETAKGSKEIKILPASASVKAQQALSAKFDSIELKEVGNGVVYVANKEKQYRIFGLIPASARVVAEVNAETGETTVSRPWYASISTDVSSN